MSCMENYIKDANFADTGFSYTMSLISGKHKMVILYCLMEFEPVRFNEMKRYLGVITDKTLSRPAYCAERVSADSTESRVFAVRARKVSDESA